MLVVKFTEVRDNLEYWCDKVNAGETVIISRPKNENIIMLSENEYNNLMRDRRNAEYLAKLDRSREELERGDVVIMTIEELEQMANE